MEHQLFTWTVLLVDDNEDRNYHCHVSANFVATCNVGCDGRLVGR